MTFTSGVRKILTLFLLYQQENLSIIDIDFHIIKQCENTFAARRSLIESYGNLFSLQEGMQLAKIHVHF